MTTFDCLKHFLGDAFKGCAQFGPNETLAIHALRNRAAMAAHRAPIAPAPLAVIVK